MQVERVKMSDTEEKLCFNFDYPKKFLGCISLEKGALVLSLIISLFNIAHIGITSYFISLGADITNLGELVVVGGSKEEVYRINFGSYISAKTAEDWEHWVKVYGGVDIAFSLLSLVLTIIGLVGVLKRKPVLVALLFLGVCVFNGLWIGTILSPAINSVDFTISSGLAWTLTIASLFVIIGVLFYLSVCVYALYLKLGKEKKDAQQVTKTFFVFYISAKTKVDLQGLI